MNKNIAFHDYGLNDQVGLSKKGEERNEGVEPYYWLEKRGPREIYAEYPYRVRPERLRA